ncbi:MAG TPA: MBL fold metallo-hydrolase [Candidatus Acidoferrales bacterium]|nr:MBL fold metallo-hydrolase [Candidatus Acidoferrales bacterium]
MTRAFLLFLFTCAAVRAQDTRVILLGTGTPNPEPDRMGPAVAVVSGDRVYLVDCGPGIVRRAAQAGIRMEQVTRLFITHLHSDHTAGYPDVILTPPNDGRKAPIDVWGPPGTKAMTAHILKAWDADLRIRLHGMQPAEPRGFTVAAHDVKPGEVYHDDALRVVAIAVKHGEWKYAYGYRFEARDRTIVISGDTTYSESLIAAAKGCDILVHEVYSQKGWERRTPEWRQYHAAYHTPAPDVGRVAVQVRPRKLVLYHLLPMGESPEEVIGEVRQNWDGEVIYGKDLEVIR